ncbi:MAG: hypothetical protein H6Q59_2312 [Firmicutes bacterium]|nr:hypothetical protein [Bacillota bacterium]
MSKILFWSPLHGQGQTSNLQVTALIMSMLFRKKILLMQTHYNNNNLESPLVGYHHEGENEKSSIFYGIGLDMAVTYSNMKKVDREILDSCCLTFSETSLLLLPGTQTQCRETFDRDIAQPLIRLIQDANECVDLVLIDANSGSDQLSMKLMEQADLIVINLTQRRFVINKFFEDYGERFLENEKIFYLFGDYDGNSSYNINNCRRKYSKYLKVNNSGVIPYCTKLMDAQNEGKIVNFIKDGVAVRSKQKDSRLFHQNKRLYSGGKLHKQETDYFFQMAGLSVEKILKILLRV